MFTKDPVRAIYVCSCNIDATEYHKVREDDEEIKSTHGKES